MSSVDDMAIDEISQATGEMSLNDLADNYTTGFPSEEQSKSPPKTVYSGEYNWDKIGTALDKDDTDVTDLAAASASAPPDQDQAAELTQKAEEHDAAAPPADDDDDWGTWTASGPVHLEGLPGRALQMAKEMQLDAMD